MTARTSHRAADPNRPTRPPADAPAAADAAEAADAEASQTEAAETAGGLPDNLPWAPKNLLVPYLLLALSAYEAHGYLLQQYLRGLGFLSTNITTIYRTLRDLERKGLVSSYWQPTDEGPARRMYTLTDAGRGTLGVWAGALESYRAMIDGFFRMYGLGGAPPSTPDASAGARAPRREKGDQA